MNNSLAPIVLFAYNRPEHLKRCVESLAQNTLAAESHLYVVCDGAKDITDKPLTEQVRNIARKINGFGQLTLIERKTNYGLANNIMDAVTSIVNEHGRIIVVEDDLVLAPYFLQFMNDALNAYANEPRVGHIQACDFTKDASLPDTFLIRWTGSWGWGTWQRAWKLFRPNGTELLRELEERRLTSTFDFNNAYGFTRMLRRQIEGKNNSWAIRWNATLFLNDMLSLNVGRSLVQNEGFDGSGTNCGGGGLYASDLYKGRLEVVKPDIIEENKAARRAFERYYRRTNSFQAKAWRRLKRMLRGDFKA